MGTSADILVLIEKLQGQINVLRLELESDRRFSKEVWAGIAKEWREQKMAFLKRSGQCDLRFREGSQEFKGFGAFKIKVMFIGFLMLTVPPFVLTLITIILKIKELTS